ncbi:MAG TPA: alpha/beta hydrolase, partial [Zeimonas sp.]|nr:alpha/beta hydrolase [Zeimonas sp.]
GDDDQIVPVDVAGRRTARLVKNARLIEYGGAPHGLTETHKDRLDADLLDFIRS